MTSATHARPYRATVTGGGGADIFNVCITSVIRRPLTQHAGFHTVPAGLRHKRAGGGGGPFGVTDTTDEDATPKTHPLPDRASSSHAQGRLRITVASPPTPDSSSQSAAGTGTGTGARQSDWMPAMSSAES